MATLLHPPWSMADIDALTLEALNTLADEWQEAHQAEAAAKARKDEINELAAGVLKGVGVLTLVTDRWKVATIAFERKSIIEQRLLDQGVTPGQIDAATKTTMVEYLTYKPIKGGA